MTKKRIAMFFLVLLLFSFCTFAQTQSETRNLRVTYDVVDRDTGLLVRSSTLIVTVSGPITSSKILTEAASALGFTRDGIMDRLVSGNWIHHRLIIKDYVIIE